MAMKGYSTFHKAPRLEPHHKMQFCAIPKRLENSDSMNYRIDFFVFSDLSFFGGLGVSVEGIA